MRVLQVHNGYRERGGEDVVIDREADLLRWAGHEVTQFLATNPTDRLTATRRLLVAPWNRASRDSLSEVIEEVKPDVVHIHNTWFSLSPSVIAAVVAQGLPVVMSLHNYRLTCINGLLLRDGGPCRLCVGNSPANGVRFRCYRESLPASAIAATTLSLNRWKGTWDDIALFLANSGFLRDTYVAAGFAADRMAIKHNFATDPGRRTTPVEESDVLLFVGRLAPEKGIDFLARAWSSSDHRRLRLRVVGDGPLLASLQQDHPDIEFTGALGPERVAEEMLAARALLFPSLAYEACPLVVLEAFSSGLPVMASDHGAMVELVAPLGSRWLRAAADHGHWVDGLSMLDDHEQVRVAGRRARRAYEAAYTPETALRGLEDAYGRVTS